MKKRLGSWFRQIWPTDQRRMHVLGDYAAIGKYALTDIALRGNVYSDLDVAGDANQTFINIGRRQLALEILELSRTEPERLLELIEQAPRKALIPKETAHET